jgi:hypothetical protein
MDVSPRFGKPYSDGPTKGLIDHYNDPVVYEAYYERSGWDIATSKPLPETLEKLDLGYIIEDIWDPNEVASLIKAE